MIVKIIIIFSYVKVQVKVHHEVVYFHQVGSARIQAISGDMHFECWCLNVVWVFP